MSIGREKLNMPSSDVSVPIQRKSDRQSRDTVKKSDIDVKRKDSRSTITLRPNLVSKKTSKSIIIPGNSGGKLTLKEKSQPDSGLFIDTQTIGEDSQAANELNKPNDLIQTQMVTESTSQAVTDGSPKHRTSKIPINHQRNSGKDAGLKPIYVKESISPSALPPGPPQTIKTTNLKISTSGDKTNPKSNPTTPTIVGCPSTLLKSNPESPKSIIMNPITPRVSDFSSGGLKLNPTTPKGGMMTMKDGTHTNPTTPRVSDFSSGGLKLNPTTPKSGMSIKDGIHTNPTTPRMSSESSGIGFRSNPNSPKQQKIAENNSMGRSFFSAADSSGYGGGHHGQGQSMSRSSSKLDGIRTPQHPQRNSSAAISRTNSRNISRQNYDGESRNSHPDSGVGESSSNPSRLSERTNTEYNLNTMVNSKAKGFSASSSDLGKTRRRLVVSNNENNAIKNPKSPSSSKPSGQRPVRRWSADMETDDESDSEGEYDVEVEPVDRESPSAMTRFIRQTSERLKQMMIMTLELQMKQQQLLLEQELMNLSQQLTHKKEEMEEKALIDSATTAAPVAHASSRTSAGVKVDSQLKGLRDDVPESDSPISQHNHSHNSHPLDVRNEVLQQALVVDDDDIPEEEGVRLRSTAGGSHRLGDGVHESEVIDLVASVAVDEDTDYYFGTLRKSNLTKVSEGSHEDIPEEILTPIAVGATPPLTKTNDNEDTPAAGTSKPPVQSLVSSETGTNVLNSNISARLGSLDELHRVYPWIPSSRQFHPSQKALEKKLESLNNIAKEWVSLEAYFLHTIFEKKYHMRKNGLKDIKVRNRDVTGLVVFRESQFPLELDEEGRHFVLWFGYKENIYSDEEISHEINIALSSYVGSSNYVFVWYADSLHDMVDQYFHVQVFWRKT